MALSCNACHIVVASDIRHTNKALHCLYSVLSAVAMATGAASTELSRLLRRRLALLPNQGQGSDLNLQTTDGAMSSRSPTESPMLDPLSLPAWIQRVYSELASETS